MTSFRHIVTVMVLMVVATAGLAVQDHLTRAQDTACSGHEMLIPFSADTQYDAACAVFLACMDVAEDYMPCMPHFYAERAEMCEPDNDICVAQARLHTALIELTVGNAYYGPGQPDKYWTGLADRIGRLMTFDATAIEDALAWYEPLTAIYNSEYIQHPMLAFSNGVLRLLYGDTEAALELTHDAIRDDSNNALLYLTRGDLYAAGGENKRAALDYFMASALSSNAGLSKPLETLLTARTSEYPIDFEVADASMLYPMWGAHSGPGGTALIDMNLEAPIEFYLQPYDELLLFIPANLEQEREEDPYRVLLPVYVMRRSTDESFIWHGGDYDADFGSSLTLTQTENGFNVKREDYRFEATSARESLLVPKGSDDPRPEGFRCEGAPVSRLMDATVAFPLRWWDTVKLYDEPGGDVAEIKRDKPLSITLIGELKCLGGFTWWPVIITQGEAKHTGWITENEDSISYLYDWIERD